MDEKNKLLIGIIIYVSAHKKEFIGKKLFIYF